jgi:hypothetical protein
MIAQCPLLLSGVILINSYQNLLFVGASIVDSTSSSWRCSRYLGFGFVLFLNAFTDTHSHQAF